MKKFAQNVKKLFHWQSLIQVTKWKLQVAEDEVVTAGTAAVLSGKLLQLCNGAVYNENGCVTEVHDCKIEALLETVEQLGGQHALICYNFKHDLDRLLTALRPLGLNVQVYHGKDEEDAWNAGEIDLLLIQPASCGYEHPLPSDKLLRCDGRRNSGGYPEENSDGRAVQRIQGLLYVFRTSGTWNGVVQHNHPQREIYCKLLQST